MKLFYEIKAQAGDSRAEIWIYQTIGEDFWGEGVTAKKFVEEINALDVAQIDMHINSPGGSVWDGQAIYNAVYRHPANVTTYVDGLAASIASIIALAGNEVVMAENALMMIHDPLAIVIGTAKDMRDGASVLDKIGETIQGIYAKKSGKPVDEIATAMAEETWFTAAEAVDYGLADEVSAELKVAALARDEKVMAHYKHVPAALAEESQTEDEREVVPAAEVAEGKPEDSTASGADVDEGGAPEETKKPKASVSDFEFARIKHRRKQC